MILSVLTFRQSRMFADVETLYRTTIERNPNCWLVQNNLGNLLVDQGHVGEAILHLQEALKSKHNSVDTCFNLGNALRSERRTDEAILYYKEALRIDHNYVPAYCNLGSALASQGRLREAITHYHNALRIDPNDVHTLNGLALLRATCPQSAFRNGAEAVDLAQRAFRLSKEPEPSILDTLAAAYAEAGRFPEAVQTARRALELAKLQHNKTLAKSVTARIRLYEAATPYREPASAPTPAAQPRPSTSVEKPVK
jgi:tetratricopeptide (TPR) repeat protein